MVMDVPVDRLVYALPLSGMIYGLSEVEIRTVEGKALPYGRAVYNNCVFSQLGH